MSSFHSQPYSVLGFYKILESAWPNGNLRARKIADAASELFAEYGTEYFNLNRLGYKEEVSSDQVADYLYQSGRQAVAHANKSPTVDPDEISQQRQMSVAGYLLRQIARICIQREFQVSTNPWDQNDLEARF